MRLQGCIIWFNGLSGSGKTSISMMVKSSLEASGKTVTLLDGDSLRQGLNRDLTFSSEDRAENIRRAAEIAKFLCESGQIVVAAFITPLESIRTQLRNLLGSERFVEIFVDCPLEICEERDPKGLYRSARNGITPEFTGISSLFEPPAYYDLKVSSSELSPIECRDRVLSFIYEKYPDLRSFGQRRRSSRSRNRRLVVLGLDCAPAGLIFDEFRDDLPVLNSLMEHGRWGSLLSTHPPITIPAWTSITTGMDPGQLGIYGFRNRIPNSYELARLETSATVRHPRIWDYLEDKGHSSILIGIPQTYPARPHNGITVGDFLAPRVDQRFTYPSDLFYELNSLSSGEYLPDVKDFRTSEKDRLLESLYEMVDRRFNLLNKIVHRKNWNFLMMVEIALDRLHHGFWRFCRKDHHLFEPGNKFENVFREFYKYLDSKIGTFLALIDDNTDVMVISDHGARTMLGGFCINEWLVRKGLLHLKPHSNGNGSIKPEYIDWDRTKVWSEGGYYARIFINLEGRDPNGIVSASEYDSLRNRLSHELESLSYDDGKPMRNIVLKPEEIYRTTESFPPDLMVYFDELNRRSIGSVGDGRLHVQGNDTGPDDANHDPEGIFIFTHLSDLRSGRIINERIPAASCLDITPTILHQFRLAVPKEMTGKVISTNGIEHASVVPAKKIPRTPPSDRGFTADEEEIVTSRLRDLGYI